MTIIKHDIAFSPSLLAADFSILGKECSDVILAGADFLHIDVMDNHYVPNLTFGPLICHALKKAGITTPFDVHLMCSPVDTLIQAFAAAGATYITFHPEATHHVDRSIKLAISLGCKVGLALNPATPLAVLDHVLDQLDMVVVMSVNPGLGGQAFIPASLEKIAAIRSRIDTLERPIRLEVDGGVNQDTIGAIHAAGADTFVMGSALFGSDNYVQTLSQCKTAIATHAAG